MTDVCDTKNPFGQAKILYLKKYNKPNLYVSSYSSLSADQCTEFFTNVTERVPPYILRWGLSSHTSFMLQIWPFPIYLPFFIAIPENSRVLIFCVGSKFAAILFCFFIKHVV